MPRTGQKTASPRRDALRGLWAMWPCQKPAGAPVRARFDTGSRQSCHAKMPLRYLWARSPCQRADLELDPHLNIHEKGPNHGQTLDPHLNIHEKGSNHGQTPDPHLNIHEKGSNHGQTPDLNLLIQASIRRFLLYWRKSGVSTRAPYPVYGVFCQKA